MTSLHAHGGGLADIELEVGRLAMLCGVSLLKPGVIEAIFHRDDSVCQHSNRIAWTKLRGLLILRYYVVARSAKINGSAMAAAVVQQSAERVRGRLQPRGWA